ncbi:hypothetical protein [Mycobacterium avium]|uniref:hypothetical protein n=1 Tax=Mycobacterium avium TaxID=1764 RepID=UPI0007A070FB|nr:hypothetical protein [Mycobacterium avium]
MNKNRDLTTAWVLAANCSLYEEDPGPAVLNIASAAEPYFVSRGEAFRDLYTRLLLEELEADSARVAALAGALNTVPRTSPEVATVWNIAAELCRRVAEIIDLAQAATDARARRRLLAGTIHLNRSVVLGQWVPAYQQQLDNELFAALAHDESGPQ